MAITDGKSESERPPPFFPSMMKTCYGKMTFRTSSFGKSWDHLNKKCYFCSHEDKFFWSNGHL